MTITIAFTMAFVNDHRDSSRGQHHKHDSNLVASCDDLFECDYNDTHAMTIA